MSWDCLRDEKRKARKKHQCFLCAEPIEPGETYCFRFGFDDGDPVETKMHVDCERYTQSWDDMDWESATGGSISRDEVRDHLGVQ